MAEQFQPGDMVECVDTRPPVPLSPTRVHDVSLLSKGALYTVTRVGLSPKGLRELFIDVTGKRGPRGYHPDRFRRVYRPSADLIAKLTAEPVLPEAPKVKRRVSA
jgi:hypothetical protein